MFKMRKEDHPFFKMSMTEQRDTYPSLNQRMRALLFELDNEYMTTFCNELVTDIRIERLEMPSAKRRWGKSPDTTERVRERRYRSQVRACKQWLQNNWHLMPEPQYWNAVQKQAIKELRDNFHTVPTKAEYYRKRKEMREADWAMDSADAERYRR